MMFRALSELLNAYPAWQVALIVVSLSVATAVVVEVVGLRVLRTLVTRTGTEFDAILLQELRFPITLSIALAGVFVFTREPAIVDSMALSRRQVEFFFAQPAGTLVVLAWAWGLNQAVNRSVEYMKTVEDRFDFAPVFSNVWTFLVVFGGGGLVLYIWDVNVTPLLAGASIAGAAVGLAAKDAVANFFGGIALYFDNTYAIGDYVVLDSGEEGIVVEVGVRSTTIQTRDAVRVTVPNSRLNSEQIHNQSTPTKRKRIRVPVNVGYDTDLDHFEDLVTSIAEEADLVLDDPEPKMRFRDLDPSALHYELFCWIERPMASIDAEHELNRKILRTLRKEGIEMPYPKRDVTVTQAEAQALPEGAQVTGTVEDISEGSLD